MSFRPIFFLRKLLRAELFERLSRQSHNFRYLTPEYVAELEKISLGRARTKLENATKDGFMEKRFLYSNIDLDLNILVNADQIGKVLTGDDIPELTEMEDVFISPEFVREIYVAA